MICDLLALRPISHITQKTLSYLHSTKIERMTKTMIIFKRGAIFLCCVRCDPIPPQTSVQRLAHTRNVTTCCSSHHCLKQKELEPHFRQKSFCTTWPSFICRLLFTQPRPQRLLVLAAAILENENTLGRRLLFILSASSIWTRVHKCLGAVYIY